MDGTESNTVPPVRVTDEPFTASSQNGADSSNGRCSARNTQTWICLARFLSWAVCVTPPTDAGVLPTGCAEAHHKYVEW